MADRKYTDIPERGPSAGPAESSRESEATSAPTGRVVHDSRGNAVWDWLKQTSRHALDSTSRLLKRLETPELKVEDQPDELRLESNRDAGGGYDPYNAKSPPRQNPRRK